MSATRTRKVKPEITVNLVRNFDSDTYEIVQDMTPIYAHYEVTHEKSRVDGKMYGYFFVKSPK